MNFYIFFILLLLAACAARREMYVVSIVEKSSLAQPVWLSRYGGGAFLGIGEAPTMEAANRAALEDLMRKISQEIGVELVATGEIVKTETSTEYSERSSYQLDALSASLLRDIGRRVTNSYWEHCRAQTDKKIFNDFYRYYILAEIPGSFVDTLRAQTHVENETRLAQIEANVKRANDILSAEEAVKPMDAFGELATAMQTAATLFYNRNATLESLNDRMITAIRSLRINILQTYSEVRPERHYIVFEVRCNDQPASGLKLRFGLTQGWGSVKESAISGDDGSARCDVLQMQSQQADNKISASLDMTDLLTRIGSIHHPSTSTMKAAVEQAINSLVRSEVFSTQSKRAKITSGSIFISDVAGRRVSLFYRRVRKLDVSLSLTEHNGRDVTFDKYAVRVDCWYMPDFFSAEPTNDWRNGIYPLNNSVFISHYSTRDITLPYNEPVASLINDLKAAHEHGMKQIAVQIRLIGKDDAGNDIEVEVNSEPITWDRLFEK